MGTSSKPAYPDIFIVQQVSVMINTNPYDFFNRVVALQEEDKSLLEESWRGRKKLKRGELLLSPGQTERRLYFVEQGSLHLYFSDNKDQAVTIGFGYDGDIVSAIPSFLLQQPSDFGIQALSKCQLHYIEKKDFISLRQASVRLEQAWQIVIEQALIGLIEREKNMLVQDPRQRLQGLLERSPHVFQYIPHKYIASYLRMSPETLSRIFRALNS